MAKYHVNHTKMQRMRDSLKLVTNKTKPIVIPRHKVDAAHAKVRKTVFINKILIISNLVLFLIIIFILFKRGAQ